VRVSINITNYSWHGDLAAGLSTVAQAADAGGIDTLWVSDHLVQADPTAAPGETEMLEAYTALGFLAGRTARVRLGAMVSPVFFRAPSLLIKGVTTLDVLSGGRAWLGLGAGYQEEEAKAMGLTMPPTAERFDQLERTLELANEMWAGGASPQPVARPPILIGGMGERRTLRLVARYADACNLFDIPDGGRTIRHKLDVLARHCEEVGRPYEEIEKTVSTRVRADESPQDVAERLAALADLGIDHAVFITPGTFTPETVAIVAAALTRS
jgi:alkanesulfonate monooxygenase SsuD/methylene tetrahydromethanopterin reductase-like flavin-dependent oxidoreductase (luciferase family)